MVLEVPRLWTKPCDTHVGERMEKKAKAHLEVKHLSLQVFPSASGSLSTAMA